MANHFEFNMMPNYRMNFNFIANLSVKTCRHCIYDMSRKTRTSHHAFKNFTYNSDIGFNKYLSMEIGLIPYDKI